MGASDESPELFQSLSHEMESKTSQRDQSSGNTTDSSSTHFSGGQSSEGGGCPELATSPPCPDDLPWPAAAWLWPVPLLSRTASGRYRVIWPRRLVAVRDGRCLVAEPGRCYWADSPPVAAAPARLGFGLGCSPPAAGAEPGGGPAGSDVSAADCAPPPADPLLPEGELRARVRRRRSSGPGHPGPAGGATQARWCCPNCSPVSTDVHCSSLSDCSSVSTSVNCSHVAASLNSPASTGVNCCPVAARMDCCSMSGSMNCSPVEVVVDYAPPVVGQIGASMDCSAVTNMKCSPISASVNFLVSADVNCPPSSTSVSSTPCSIAPTIVERCRVPASVNCSPELASRELAPRDAGCFRRARQPPSPLLFVRRWSVYDENGQAIDSRPRDTYLELEGLRTIVRTRPCVVMLLRKWVQLVNGDALDVYG